MMPELSYSTLLLHREDVRAAYIADISANFNQSDELTDGVSLKGALSESHTFSLSPKGGDLLGDFIPNISRTLIASSRAREVLESEGVTGDSVEYLPFTLLDKRGRRVKKQFYVVNLLQRVSCMDRKDSDFVGSKIDGEVLTLSSLKLLEERIPPEAKLFRLDEFPETLIIRSDLVQRLRDEKLTGFVVRALGEDIY